MEIPFMQARYYISPPTARKIDLVVLHCAVVQPSAGAAEWLMKYCAHNDRVASWHKAIDSDSITQSVKDEHIAFHAPGANRNSLGYELATHGEPKSDQWADIYHKKMLTLAAWLVAGDCVKYKLEPYFVNAAGLLEGRRGITTHAEVTAAFKKSTHTDPGPHFPMKDFLADVAARILNGNHAEA